MKSSYAVILYGLLLSIFAPLFAFASTSTTFEFGGWIPYWRKTAGVADVVDNIKHLTFISPFGYQVDAEGNLLDLAKKDDAPWTDLYRSAKKERVQVIPTILWGGAQSIDTVLANKDLRKAHITYIKNEIIKDKRFAGVDIDYEGKWASTRENFSKFLTELSVVVHDRDKILTCTIEPRTPIEDKFKVVDEKLLSSIEYSNDYKVIGQVCDYVNIMTYDQGAIDIKLSAVKKGKNFYAPVADKEWVEKVIKLAVKDIPPEKIRLGLATYGYVYELTPRKDGGYTYKRIKAINYLAAVDLATVNNKKLMRNSAGELSFTYPSTTTKGNTMLVWLSDSVAMQEKIDLVKKYNLNGVAVFKFDGEHDEGVWNVINKNI